MLPRIPVSQFGKMRGLCISNATSENFSTNISQREALYMVCSPGQKSGEFCAWHWFPY